MHGIYKSFKVNFYVLSFKKPSKYFLFCDTVFSSWVRSGQICNLPYCLILKKKRKKKGTPPWYVNVGGHLIRLKRIYNFLCSMLVFIPFALCFVTLRGIFMRFLELTY
jgi:hypothetical protein